MSRLAVAIVVAAGLSACQAWDGRYAGGHADYGYPGYGYGYPRGSGWYYPWRPYPYYAAPFGYERHLARERWLAKERRRRAARHDGKQPDGPARPGGDGGPAEARPSVKQPLFDPDAAARARMQAARQRAAEKQQLQKQSPYPSAPPTQTHAPESSPTKDKALLK